MIDVYTDGSEVRTTCTAGVVVPSRALTLSFKLAHKTSPTGAELIAIQEPVGYIYFSPPAQ